MSQPSDFYRQYSWERVVDGVQHCAPVTEGVGDFIWVVYPDVIDGCGPWELGFEELGRAGIGLTIVSHRDLFGLVDEDADYQRCGEEYAQGSEFPYGRWEGGLAHELGHTVYLDHRPGCDEGAANCDGWALMFGGWEYYPDTYLRFDDKEMLLRSRFVDGAPPNAGEVPAGHSAVVRGTVTDPDGTFEIALPEAASGSVAVSVHAGQAAGCRWLGYHAPGGLTTVPHRCDRGTSRC